MKLTPDNYKKYNVSLRKGRAFVVERVDLIGQITVFYSPLSNQGWYILALFCVQYHTRLRLLRLYLAENAVKICVFPCNMMFHILDEHHSFCWKNQGSHRQCGMYYCYHWSCVSTTFTMVNLVWFSKTLSNAIAIDWVHSNSRYASRSLHACTALSTARCARKLRS